MAPHSNTLAWKTPWTEEPDGLQSMGSLRVGHDWATLILLFTFHFHALEKETATHSSVLAWRIPGTGEPGGLPSMGSHRVGHDWSDLAAAAAAAAVDLVTDRLWIGYLNSGCSWHIRFPMVVKKLDKILIPFWKEACQREKQISYISPYMWHLGIMVLMNMFAKKK